MPKVKVYNISGEVVGDIDLSDAVFGAPVNEALLHDAVLMYRARQRLGTASTKIRSEVRGGGRKPWRQKGTGRARHGSIRTPLRRGGGITFGPRPRDYAYSLPKKARRHALVSALSARVAADGLYVVEALPLEEPKTREMARLMGDLGLDGSVLFVTAGSDANVYKSVRNLPGASAIRAGDINAYEVLAHENLVFTRDAVERVEEVLG